MTTMDKDSAATEVSMLRSAAPPTASSDPATQVLDIDLSSLKLSTDCDDSIPKITRIRILDDDCLSEGSSYFESGQEQGACNQSEELPDNKYIHLFHNPVDPALLEHVNHGFLTDPATISLLKKSKVMFILRGIPGSGKSHVGSAIQYVYPDIIRCSASDYFWKSGEYQTTRTREDQTAAHQECQEKAEKACREGKRLFIDNCHTQVWEMSFYLKMGKEYNYITLIVEPDTPWKNDPVEAASRIDGAVDVSIIKFKLSHWQNFVPKFYAWYMNAVDTLEIINVANEFYRMCYKIPEICSVMTAFGLSADPTTSYSCSYSAPGSDPILYCVTFYSNFGHKVGADKFSASQALLRAHGRVSELRIVGLVLTPDCFLARVMLSDDQIVLVNHRINTPVPPNSRPTATTNWRSHGDTGALQEEHNSKSFRAPLPENPDDNENYYVRGAEAATDSTCRWQDAAVSGVVPSSHASLSNLRAHVLLGSRDMNDCAQTAISDLQFVTMNEGSKRRPPAGATSHATFDLGGQATLVNYGSEALAIYFKRHLVVRAVLTSSSEVPMKNTTNRPTRGRYFK